MDAIVYLSLFILLVVACLFIARKQRKDIDQLFDNTADSRTQMFFFAFDNQPKPLTVSELTERLANNNGSIEIAGTYNDHPLNVELIVDQSKAIVGHIYSMPCNTNFELTAVCSSYEEETELEPLKLPCFNSSLVQSQSNRTNSGINFFSSDEQILAKFLTFEKVAEYVDHMFNSSKIKGISLSDRKLAIVDQSEKADQSFIRLKALFEMQDHLRKTLESCKV